MPRRRKSPWAIVIVVWATMTEARLASSGACPRRSQALTASPPMAAGVVRLKASPASLDANRARKATPSRRKAKRHPSVSNSVTSATGKQSEEHTSELQSLAYLVCRLLLEKKKRKKEQATSVHSI